MPLANGIEAHSEIHDKLPKTPIVMYTLYKTRELEVAAELVGHPTSHWKGRGANKLCSAIEKELAPNTSQ